MKEEKDPIDWFRVNGMTEELYARLDLTAEPSSSA
jgi:hypothetical protein